MSDVSITVNTMTPEEVTQYIDAFVKYASLLKMLNIAQVNTVIDFAINVASKPFVPKLLSLLTEIWANPWHDEVNRLVADLKKN